MKPMSAASTSTIPIELSLLFRMRTLFCCLLMLIPSLTRGASYPVNVPYGFMMLANHHAPANIQTYLAPPFPQLSETQMIFPFDLYFTNPADIFIFDGATWLDFNTAEPAVKTLSTGEGAFYFNPYPGFVGTIAGPASAGVVQLNPSAPGWHMRGRQNIGPGTFESAFGRSPKDYAFVHAYRFLNGNYVSYQFAKSPNPANCRWSPEAPILGVGEAMWCRLGALSGPSNPQYFAPQPINFTLSGVTPGTTNQVANPVTIQVTGTGLDNGDQIRLLRMGNGPQTPWVNGTADPDGYILTATMNLNNLSKGYYRVSVRKSGNNIQSLDYAFYLDIPGSQLVVTMAAAPQTLPNVPIPCQLCVMNPTANTINNVDLSAVIPGVGVIIGAPTVLSTGVTPNPTAQVANPGVITANAPLQFTPNASACYSFSVTAPLPLVNSTLQLVGQITSPNSQIGQSVQLMEIVSSMDPNDKVGPIGISPARYITGLDPSDYTIRFENMPDASAPAHEVVITDWLDTSRLNLATFELGTVKFGPKTVTPPPGLANWTTQVPYDVDGDPNTTTDNILVQIDATLDGLVTSPTYGLVKWKFSSLESTPPNAPVTLPNVGFLPANQIAPEGQGSVSFRITPFSNVPSGDTITNQANIVFDTNDPILTGVWTNTIDMDLPSSSVQSLMATQTVTSFTVAWSGEDADSGIERYDVYVSDNGGSFEKWQAGTTNVSAVFNGQANHNYRFYSVATDKVGHVETAPEPDYGDSIDAETTIVLSCPPATLGIRLVDDEVELTWTELGYRLQASGDLQEWEDVSDAGSPTKIPTKSGFRGFRLICR